MIPFRQNSNNFSGLTSCVVDMEHLSLSFVVSKMNAYVPYTCGLGSSTLSRFGSAFQQNFRAEQVLGFPHQHRLACRKTEVSGNQKGDQRGQQNLKRAAQ